jgi:hypothetical protein
VGNPQRLGVGGDQTVVPWQNGLRHADLIHEDHARYSEGYPEDHARYSEGYPCRPWPTSPGPKTGNGGHLPVQPQSTEVLSLWQVH